MFSLFVAPFLMLLTVFGLYSPQPPHLPTLPSAPVRAEIREPAKESVATSSAVAHKRTRTTTERQPVPEPEPVRVSIENEATPVALRTRPTNLSEDIRAATNASRASEGLSLLSADPRLADLAAAHSADMLARNYFNHTNREGCSVSCRATESGYEWQAIGENIYYSSGYDIDQSDYADSVVRSWMNSPGHRANMLSPSFTQVGIGIATLGEKAYVTAVYAKPR